MTAKYELVPFCALNCTAGFMLVAADTAIQVSHTLLFVSIKCQIGCTLKKNKELLGTYSTPDNCKVK